MDNNFYEEEKQAELDRAKFLIEKGKELAQQKQGNIKGITNLYIQSINIYLEIGEYSKISRTFNELVSFVKYESEVLFIIEKIQNIINSIEHLNIPEEMGKIKLALGNLYYKNGDYLKAGNLFIDISNLFFKVDMEGYRRTSGILLIRAAECFEKINRYERAEKIILKAIRKLNTSIFNYEEKNKFLIKEINEKNFDKAVSTLTEITNFFTKLKNDLEKSDEFSKTFRNIKNNIIARINHIIDEYNLIKMFCFRNLEQETKVLEQAKESVKELSINIDILKEEIKDGYYSRADLHRLTFDLFLLQIFQEYADYQVEDPVDLAIRGLPMKIKKILQKMKFFNFTLQVLELDLDGCVEIFEDLPLSRVLVPFREFIIRSIEKI